MKPHQRVEVLLTLLGGQQRVSLSREAIEPGVTASLRRGVFWYC